MTFFLRPARSTDAGKLAAIMSAAIVAKPWKPRLHSGAEDIAFVAQMIDKGWVTVAEDLEKPLLLGFLARNGAEVNALFVVSSSRDMGVGRALMADAKARSKTLELWTFEANTGAQRFYQREGFQEVRRTDGRENEEGLADVFYRWERTPDRAQTPARPATAPPPKPSAEPPAEREKPTVAGAAPQKTPSPQAKP